MDEPTGEPETGPVRVPVEEADAVEDAAVVAVAMDPWATFDRWASWFCLAMALLTGLVGLLAIGPVLGTELHPVLAALMLAIIAGQAVLLYAVSAGLSRGWTWARPAVFWVLLLAVVTGLGGAVVDLTHSKLTIPLGAILGMVILARAPGRVQAGTTLDARRSTLVGLAFLLLTVLPGAVAYATTDVSSPLVAKADDLALVVDVACEGDGTEMPERIDARLSWTWRDRDVFPGRPDTAGIGWPTDDDRVSGFTLDESTKSDPAFVPGGDGLSLAAVEAALASGDAWSWSVGDVGQTSPDGWVSVVLVPRDDARGRPADGSVRIVGVYAHLDRWTVRVEGRCGWGAEATAP